MKKAIVTVALVAALTAGCDRTEYVAQVGDEKISKAEYDSYLKFKRIPMQDKERDTKILDQFVEREALAQAIEQSDKMDKALLDAELQEFRRQALVSRYFDNYLKDSVTDEAIRNFYSNNAERFQSQKVHAAHILLRLDPKMDESQQQARLTQAHEIYSKLQAGEDFETVARQFSEDKVSAEKGGDLGWLQEGAVAELFSEKAFSLKKAEISEPFRTTFGFHIVKVLEEPQIVKQPLEAVKGDIRYELRNQMKQAETERLLTTVKYSVKK